ncbi:hypothetical protein [Marinicellulosiphila megalodicopiae]|uniref:hypothetical protein n=1 Tax=Marinicellulosiphila megalodicopiae TaxID=2724896 RepID=UPI003BB03811
MFKFQTASILIGTLALISTANADEMATETCQPFAKEQVSIYYSKTIELNGDPGKIYEQSIAQVNDIALKNGFKSYKMNSNGISISTSSYNGMLDVSINIDIEYLSDFKAITALSKESAATSISSQRYFEGCE